CITPLPVDQPLHESVGAFSSAFVPLAAKPSTLTKVPNDDGFFLPSTEIVIVCCVFVRPVNSSRTPNVKSAGYRSTVPLLTPSMLTLALPSMGPVTVVHVTVGPVNANDTVSPAVELMR